MAGSIKDKEAFQRLNFLYQAAHCVLAQSPDNAELARFYCFTQKTIARRLVLRQDPSVKRTICKRCCGLLVPGVTGALRQRKRKGKQRVTVLRCLSCGQTRKLPNNPDHRLWVDQPEALLENQPQQGLSAWRGGLSVWRGLLIADMIFSSTEETSGQKSGAPVTAPTENPTSGRSKGKNLDTTMKPDA
ncbi:ribonuclease P protein subunit p21 isoform X1 [Clupea harengus]|uniref:Ribonuclease P protein subunit p21 isoform X1 n=1 Tax=Clupea harengus TaxID=7950 RepID=A0A6P8FTX4_CLUHA|nr:ribonuclease P protein subunit p21 isoform X1 [Clupea harengus]